MSIPSAEKGNPLKIEVEVYKNEEKRETPRPSGEENKRINDENLKEKYLFFEKFPCIFVESRGASPPNPLFV